MTIFSILKNRREIEALKKEKDKLLEQIPTDKIRRFNSLCNKIKNGDGCKRSRKEVLKIYNSLDELGLKQIAEKIGRINQKIRELKK